MSWRLETRRSRASLANCVFVVFSGLAAAQAPDIVLGSRTAGTPPSTNDEFLPSEIDAAPPLQFSEINSTNAPGTSLASLQRHTVGPFDESRYGFRFVDVYLDRTLPPIEERDSLSSNATLRLILVTRTSTGRGRLFTLEPTADAAPNPLEDLLIVEDSANADEQARLATSDASLPILDVQYKMHFFGANAGSEWERHLVADLRGSHPRIIAVISNGGHFGGGACTAFDSIYASRKEVGCRWDRTLGKFRCAETLHTLRINGEHRRGSRYFSLDPMQRLPNPYVRETLQQLAARAQIAAAPTRVVTELGSTTLLDVAAFGAARVSLFGAPLLTELDEQRFDGRLHLVVTRDNKTLIREIIPRLSLDQERPSGSYAALKGTRDLPSDDFTPDGAAPVFRADVLFNGDQLRILRVMLAEKHVRGVYLVGIDASGPEIVADALLIASNAPVYDSCSAWRLPATAVRMELQTQPFSAVLDVEPSNLESRNTTLNDDWDLIARSETPVCRTTTTVTWRAATGFHTDSRTLPCVSSEPPRRVEIDDEGRISSAARLHLERPER